MNANESESLSLSKMRHESLSRWLNNKQEEKCLVIDSLVSPDKEKRERENEKRDTWEKYLREIPQK